VTEYSERFSQPEPPSESFRIEKLRSALRLVLDQADYEAGNCRINEMVGAVLPKEVLRIAKEALKP
jgi:hypothetical protein